MIEILDGDLFKSDCNVYVNTVNTVGVMGKGIALEFKKRYPKNFELYHKACKNGYVRIGSMYITENTGFVPVYIFNFPTKRHWREPSRLSFIDMGMRDLVHCIKTFNVESIAIPALGCTNGGLKWSDVKPVVLKHLEPIQDKLEIKFYKPQH